MEALQQKESEGKNLTSKVVCSTVIGGYLQDFSSLPGKSYIFEVISTGAMSPRITFCTRQR